MAALRVFIALLILTGCGGDDPPISECEAYDRLWALQDRVLRGDITDAVMVGDRATLATALEEARAEATAVRDGLTQNDEPVRESLFLAADLFVRGLDLVDAGLLDGEFRRDLADEGFTLFTDGVVHVFGASASLPEDCE